MRVTHIFKCMDFNERVIPNVSANFLFKEALARYEFAKKVMHSKKKKDAKILDLGCGTGYGSALLSENGAVVGMDRNRKAIAYATKRYGRKAQFKLGNVEEFKIYLGLFDVISAFEIIEHLKNPRAFLKNACKSLRSNGIMILSTPNAVSHPNTPKSPYHEKEYTKREFEKLLNSFFSHVEMYGQVKNKNAKKALSSFMDSQKKRQEFVNKDTWGIRKLIPKSVKEKIWKYMGSLYGRKPQDNLETRDFPIKKENVPNAEYFIAVCTK